MFDIQNYASFIAAILIFQLIPGPGTLAILTATARSGIEQGSVQLWGPCSEISPTWSGQSSAWLL